MRVKWAGEDSNLRPADYECAPELSAVYGYSAFSALVKRHAPPRSARPRPRKRVRPRSVFAVTGHGAAGGGSAADARD